MALGDNIRLLHHSSIRIEGEKKVIYVDPFEIEGEAHDADIIFTSHEHFDHFSPEDIKKIAREDTVLVAPASMEELAASAGLFLYTIEPGEEIDIDDIHVKASPAATPGRPFHPLENKWVGYVIILDGSSIYVAGDTDYLPELKDIKCNVAMLPIGGKYTMDAEAAAKLANDFSESPDLVIPTHYGSVAGSKEDEERFKSLVSGGTRVEVKMEKY